MSKGKNGQRLISQRLDRKFLPFLFFYEWSNPENESSMTVLSFPWFLSHIVAIEFLDHLLMATNVRVKEQRKGPAYHFLMVKDWMKSTATQLTMWGPWPRNDFTLARSLIFLLFFNFIRPSRWYRDWKEWLMANKIRREENDCVVRVREYSANKFLFL